MSSPHMLALSGLLGTFGQTLTPFTPKLIAELTVANCIAIAVLQNFLISNSEKNVI